MKIVNKSHILILLLFCSVGFSQPNGYRLASEIVKVEMEKKVIAASKQILSLQCNFVQEKSSVLLTETAVSKGMLSYKKSNLLRWEYTSPNKLLLVMNGENVQMKNEQGTISNSNKMFKQLSGFIVSTINGEALSDNTNFKAEYYLDARKKDFVWIKLIPINKRIKEMYLSIWIKMETTNYLASEIIMEEKSGDKTIIKLSNPKLNIDIPLKQFSIN